MKLTIISDKGSPMMVVTKVARKGSSLEVTGQMMGAWPAKMYITPKEFWTCIRLALSPGVLLYLIAYPFILVSSLFKKKEK
ncbi:MAG: hypothetical protein KKF62_13155 [Bacteroidetes bacterium]|nr:hypothetical protein [Bacteroidota bacterium]MBU1116928.1 hypothetical protein [Bacteroidota bacterium]MBU1799394.1 hypothetical protein [Bacteroidota bacterium]